jgi:lambda family phage portal protein
MKRPTLNRIERAIASLSPAWGVQRLRNKTVLAFAGGYEGASRRRPSLAGYNPLASDPNDEISPALPALRARSRDLCRNNPLAGGAISNEVASVVGTGLSLQSRIDADYLDLGEDQADTWQRATEREFLYWAESVDCDASRHQDFYGLQALAFRSILESGDCLALTPSIQRHGVLHPLAVQLVEADRLCNPDRKADNDSLIAGIEIDPITGEALRAHVANRNPNSYRSRATLKWTSVQFRSESGRRNALLLFDRRRPGQVRGVPKLAAVIEPLKQLGRYTEAELQAAVISGAFSVFITMEQEAFETLFTDADRGNYLRSATSWDGSLNRNTLEAPGKAVNLLPGERVDSVNPGRPNSEFDPFVHAILKQIALGLEVPFEVMLKHFSSSYSASRAALLDAWRFFRGRRDWLAGAFCQPIYELWLDQAVALGRIKAPGYFADPMTRWAYQRAAWVGDGPGSIDPVKEVNAAEKRIALGISTVAAESILHDGEDWLPKHRQRVREHQMREAAGLNQGEKSARLNQGADSETEEEEKEQDENLSL